jgi:hypothetical protein
MIFPTNLKAAAHNLPKAYRAVGTLLGLAVGDAVGTTLEFLRAANLADDADIVAAGAGQLAGIPAALASAAGMAGADHRVRNALFDKGELA